MAKKSTKNKHVIEFEDFNIDSDSLFEMANIMQKYTGLPMIIWISQKMATHGPRIKVQNDYTEKVSSDKFFVVTIDDNPMVIGDTGEIKQKDINKVIQFVKTHKVLLKKFWDGAIQDPFEVAKKFKKLNEDEIL